MNINVLTEHADNPSSIPDYDNITIDQIDQMDNNICRAVMLNDVLRHLTQAQLESLLSKIRHGGLITIQSPDISALAKGLYWGYINLQTFSSLLSPSTTYHSALSVKNFLEPRGYLIEEIAVQTDTSIFTIKAKRK